jgi:archaemetzincin
MRATITPMEASSTIGPLVLGVLAAASLGACRCEKEEPGVQPPVGTHRGVPETPPPPPEPGRATTVEQLEFAVTDTTGFFPLGEPRSGEWLSVHPEPGQSFAAYVLSEPAGRTAVRKEIVLQPIGTFDERQRTLLTQMARFTALWYDTPTVIAADLRLPQPPNRIRSAGGRKWGQYLTGPFLTDVLPEVLPDTAIAVVGITTADLYPEPDWNFVFGQASYHERVSIYSLARLGPEFFGEERTPETGRLELRRALQVITHELGHTFGLPHCTVWHCSMNGSNSLGESDRAPLDLCPECLRKLQWNLKFDVLARYDHLAEFLEQVGLADDAAWYRGRARHIREVQ